MVINAGAAAVRDVVSGPDLTDVIHAFNQAIRHEFYLGAALSSLTVFSALGMGWVRVARKKDQKKPSADSADAEVAKQEAKSDA